MLIFIVNFSFLIAVILLDLLLGDPRVKWHPIRLLGNLILFCENKFFQIGANGRFAGVCFALLILSVGLLVPIGIGWGLFVAPFSKWWALGFMLFLSGFLVSFRDLIQHGRAVQVALEEQTIEKVRLQTSMLVSRNTSQMDEAQASRATIESLAENMVDGVIAPLFYLFCFGPLGLIGFKCISTLDSMVGYKNEKYHAFGWASAKLDDLLCWIPARLGWLLLSLAALLLRGASGWNALKIGFKQHGLHASPNSGWSMAAVAGALQIGLGGPVVRDGKEVGEAWFGHENAARNIGPKEIQKTIQLLRFTLLVTVLFFGLLLTCLWFISGIALKNPTIFG